MTMYLHLFQSFLPLLALLTIACTAIPVPHESLVLARDDLPSLEARDDGFTSLDARDGEFSSLEARDDNLGWLAPRMFPGPGMRHKNEDNPPLTAFNPVPHNSYFPTHNNVYTGQQVNRYAGDLMSSLPATDPWNRKANSRLKSYPKPGTGFRQSEAANPAPNGPGTVAYHYPIGRPKRSNTLPSRPGGSVQVGTDRLVAYRHAGDTAHTVGVSYHDPRKPIPAPVPGGTPSRNHPFTMAPQKQGGPVKAAFAKWSKKVKNALPKSNKS